MPLLSPAAAAVAGVALLTIGQLTSPAQPASTVSFDGRGAAPCQDTRPEHRHLVLFEPNTARDRAEDEIESACGRTIAYHPEIGVAIAITADPRFERIIGVDRAYSAEKARQETSGSSGTVAARPVDQDVDVSGDLGFLLPSSGDRDANWSMRQIRAGQAHRIEEGRADVLVGVLDSGVDAGHPALADSVDASASAGCLTGAPDTSPQAWTASDSTHGTHVAGIIAADGQEMTGVAPGVRLASIRVVDEDGLIYPEYAVCGYLWAAEQGVDITNNSYIVEPWSITCTEDPGVEVAREALRRAVRHAAEHGVLTVAAAGNGGANLPRLRARGDDGSDCSPLPASLDDVVTVSAVGADSIKSGYSSYGLGVVDVAAPGGDAERATGDGEPCVRSTVPGGYDTHCGTSMAAPHATGVAALLASRHPEATPARLRTMLRDRATPLPCPADYDLNHDGVQDARCVGTSAYNGFYGTGLVDAYNAVTF